jgi:hypothetical protein
MKLSTRIARTVAVATLAVSGSIALAPAVSATTHGPSGEIGNPPTCTHGCDDGPGFGGPGDFTNPEADPTDDPKPPTDQPDDAPVIVAQPTFTG